MCWWTRCAAVRPPGRASASTFNTCRRISGRRRRSCRRFPTHGRMLIPRSGTEDRGKLERRNDLELVVAAIPRRLVVPPAQERRPVTKAIALHVVVLHFAHALDPQRLPRQILARAPAALPTRHAPAFAKTLRRGRLRMGHPGFPGMIRERVLAQRLELLHQLLASGHRE